MRKFVYILFTIAFVFTIVSCKKKKNLPEAPSNLVFTTTSTILKLQWNDNSSNEKGFYVQENYRGEWETKMPVAEGVISIEFSIYQLEENASYRIVAWNDNGESEASNSVYVPTYSSAMAYIYVCPSSASGACGISYLVLDGNCRQVNSEYSNGGWYNTGFEVVKNSSYALQFCQGCVSNCGQAASFTTPKFFLKQKYNTGLYSYCNNDPCSPGNFIE